MNIVTKGLTRPYIVKQLIMTHKILPKLMALFPTHNESEIHLSILRDFKGDPKIPNVLLKYVTWIKKSLNITNFRLLKSTWFYIYIYTYLMYLKWPWLLCKILNKMCLKLILLKTSTPIAFWDYMIEGGNTRLCS